MRGILSYTAIIIFYAFVSSWGTIINIPGDYSTIQQGIDASVDGDTVLVQPGTYYEKINFNGHNIVLGSLFLNTGDTSHISNTIIDASMMGGPVVTFQYGEDSTTVITGFTLRNGTILNGSGAGICCVNADPLICFNKIIDNAVCGDYRICGGGIYCEGGATKITDNYIAHNSADGFFEGGSGGGIYCEGGTIQITRNYIAHNTATGDIDPAGGGGIAVENCHAIISENVITGNMALGGLRGSPGGGMAIGTSSGMLQNNIIWNNVAGHAGGIYCDFVTAPITGNIIYGNHAVRGGGISCVCYEQDSSTIIINNTICNNYAPIGGGIECLGWLGGDPLIRIRNTILHNNAASIGDPQIFGNPSEVSYCNIQDSLWPGIGNISVDPLFRDSATGDFRLMSIVCGDSADSPCIDAGDPNILDSLLDCSWGLGGWRSDMGAYGGGDSAMVGIVNNTPLPGKFSLMQNYPNPFNAQTTIRFLLPEPQNVRLTIYDLLGRRIGTLLNERKTVGVHKVTFDASPLSSGVYFYRLQAGEYIVSKKLIFLK